ncbi:hypothetical protein ABW20_dc0106441 [Dactylellina cionopaga]|nr:hypothetical protein ABW20_dc0106441 [Dactylellina cionopaga]
MADLTPSSSQASSAQSQSITYIHNPIFEIQQYLQSLATQSQIDREDLDQQIDPALFEIDPALFPEIDPTLFDELDPALFQQSELEIQFQPATAVVSNITDPSAMMPSTYPPQGRLVNPSFKPFSLLPHHIIVNIIKNLSIKDLQSLISISRAAYFAFHNAADNIDPNYPGSSLASSCQPDPSRSCETVYQGILLNSLNDVRLATYLPIKYKEGTWNIMGTAKGDKIDGSKGNMMRLHIGRLYEMERCFDEILGIVHRGLDVGNEWESKKYGPLMYRTLVAFTQTHLFCVTFNHEGKRDQVTKISSTRPTDLQLPPMPPHTLKKKYTRAERNLVLAICETIWPAHCIVGYWEIQGIDRETNEWDFYVSWIVKQAFVRTAHPQLLAELMTLRRPIRTDETQGVENRLFEKKQKRYKRIMDDLEYWIRQVMRCCPGSEIWEHNPDIGQLIGVWDAVKECRGCEFDFEEVEEISADESSGVSGSEGDAMELDGYVITNRFTA